MVVKRIFWQLLLAESYGKREQKKTKQNKLKEVLYTLHWNETGLLKIKNAF